MEILTDLDQVVATMDRSLLVQIIDNLLSNAIKFSKHHTEVSIRL